MTWSLIAVHRAFIPQLPRRRLSLPGLRQFAQSRVPNSARCPQRPLQRTLAERGFRALGPRVQVDPAPRHPSLRIRKEFAAINDNPNQRSLIVTLPASDTGSNRPCLIRFDCPTGKLLRLGHREVYSASPVPPGSRFESVGPSFPAASDRMSIRQPVSLAASRAFWPSRPMASDNW